MSASDGADTTTCYYDTQNRRVKKVLDNAPDVVYIYDGWQVVEEREWNGTDTAWEPRRQYADSFRNCATKALRKCEPGDGKN